jgi:Uma2 family endonuclease
MATRPNPGRLTADGFIAWAAEQPRGRYELVAGEVVAMAPERAGHARTKARVHRALEDAVAAAGLDCEAFPDGMSVRIDEATVYEPDALVRCGPRTPDDAVEAAEPVVLVEVVSRASRSIDSGAKLADYFRLGSVRHYLVVDADRRTVTHHRREEEGEIATRIFREGRLELGPPGLVVNVEGFFVPS